MTISIVYDLSYTFLDVIDSERVSWYTKDNGLAGSYEIKVEAYGEQLDDFSFDGSMGGETTSGGARIRRRLIVDPP